MNLTNGDNNITLPDDMQWTDEFNWSSISVNTTYLLNGALLVTSAKKLAGRPITLESPNDGAWLDYNTICDLYDFANNEDNNTLQLTLADNRTFDVIFAENPLSIKPIYFSSPNSDYYLATIKFITV